MLTRMFAVIFGVVAAAVLSALLFPDAPVPQPATAVVAAASVAQKKPVEVSPFALARSINNIQRTGKDLSLTETWQQFGVEPGSFAQCSNDCKAKIYRNELSSNPGSEVVIKLTRFEDFTRYLVFGRADNGWKFLGYVDHDFNKYEIARHRIASVKGKPFLVIRGQEGSGSGYALYAETWYEVADNGLKPVLSYPSDGHTNPWPAGLSRSFVARTLPLVKEPGRVIIQYEVSYEAAGYEGDGLRLMFENQHRLSFQWDSQLRKFVPDPQRSNISQAEINAIANIETDDQPQDGTKIGETTFYSDAKSFVGGGYEVFLKHNLPRLTAIAKGRPTKSRQWLQRFLSECRDTEEKKALLTALKK